MRQRIKNAKRIVVKVGTSTLTYENGRLNLNRIELIVKQIADLMNQGKEMIFVSSGAAAAGLVPLGLKERPKDITTRQACASVGQGILLHMYEKFFREYGHTVGQILLTKEDSSHRGRYVNLRNTLFALLKLGVVPIINENDVVAIEEFKIGDNDTLSATVASIVEADLLIILSDIEGLYTANPQSDPNAKLIHTVETITPHIYEISGGAGSNRGTGGMYTKIQAAHIAVNSGVDMVISSGEHADSIRAVLDGELRGTLFVAHEGTPHMKKRWMAFGSRLKGSVTVDEGCAKAILSKGSSLLAVGIKAVHGEFSEGETISIYFNDQEIARGFVNFSSEDLELIKGHNSGDIAEILKIAVAHDEVIHRDNLVVLH
ncbi:MAG: glutamate 5-kinase [Veillonella sp.]|uniref:glutamate 5-kinase n=1 Tax=Veillonella sp. TaxID=1926307 RepID=UPI0025DEBBBD|nr:glutamate 5-kinase [Veillonella sp.]MBS4912675.1 glutamate 5-kinase [Veillonella sp.]